MSLIECHNQDGDPRAIEIDPANLYYGWVFFKPPSGHWVTLRKATEEELLAAKNSCLTSANTYSIGPSNLPPQHVIFQSPATNEEMLRIAPDGFYVRGVKVEQGPEEAKIVFSAFTRWLARCH